MVSPASRRRLCTNLMDRGFSRRLSCVVSRVSRPASRREYKDPNPELRSLVLSDLVAESSHLQWSPRQATLKLESSLRSHRIPRLLCLPTEHYRDTHPHATIAMFW